MHTPSLTAIFVHSSAEHIFLFRFRATFLGACSTIPMGNFRFLFEALVFFTTPFADDLLRAAEVSRVEDARRRVEETSADKSFFFFLASSFAAAATAAASAFLSWLSL
jgi:hypothetical protein